MAYQPVFHNLSPGYAHYGKAARLLADYGYRPQSFDDFCAFFAKAPYQICALQEADEVLAACLYSQLDDVIEIIEIAVLPERRRFGLGHLLLSKLCDMAKQAGASSMILDVAETNQAAIALYRKQHFAIIGRRNGYYRGEKGSDNQKIDASIMELKLHQT